MSAAGVPPRNTIARTSERKLPEILTFEDVSAAVTSLATEKTSSTEKRPRFQSASGTASAPTTTAAASANSSMATTNRLGRAATVGLQTGWSEEISASARAFLRRGRRNQKGAAAETVTPSKSEPARLASGSRCTARELVAVTQECPPSDWYGPPPVDECPTDRRSNCLMSRVIW